MKALRSYKLLLALLAVFMLSGCMAIMINSFKKNYTDIPETEKTLDIPVYEEPHGLPGYPYSYWHYAKQKEEQLKLPKLETSPLDQVFRVWITNPVSKTAQPHGLVRIVCDNDSCFGELLLMRVDFNRWKLREEITSTKRVNLSPTNLTWEQITDSLIILKFDELPTDDHIPGYYKGQRGYQNNTTTFSFEYSTPDQYRFYQYNDLYRAKDEFWQPQHVLKIFDLLEREFQWNTRAQKYFRG